MFFSGLFFQDVFMIAALRISSLGQTSMMRKDKLAIDYHKDTVIQQDDTDEERKQLKSDALNAI